MSTRERGPLLNFESDSASESARVTHLAPESDGDGIAFTFADSQRHVVAALGLIDRQRVHARLVWPDSVRAVWWPKPHELAFSSTLDDDTTYHIADAHAPALQVVSDSGVSPFAPPAASEQAASSGELARARTYIDSVHFQLEGRAEHSLLRYYVAEMIMAPDSSLAAFYVVAADSSGAQFNPSWYVLDTRSREIVPIDRLVGHVDAIPVHAAAWDSASHFFYVKERTLYEVRIVR